MQFVVIELPKPIPQNLLPERERSSGHKQSADRLVDLIDDGSESDLDEEAYHGTSVALPQLPPSPTEDSGV